MIGMNIPGEMLFDFNSSSVAPHIDLPRRSICLKQSQCHSHLSVVSHRRDLPHRITFSTCYKSIFVLCNSVATAVVRKVFDKLRRERFHLKCWEFCQFYGHCQTLWIDVSEINVRCNNDWGSSELYVNIYECIFWLNMFASWIESLISC